MNTEKKSKLIKNWILNLYPVYLGILLFIVGLRLPYIPMYIKIYRFDATVCALVTVCTTIIGFLFTIITILISISDKEVIKFIISNNGMSLMIMYFSIPIFTGIALLSYIIYLACIITDNLSIERKLFIILIVLIVVFLFSLARIGVNLLRIFIQIPKENSPKKIDIHMVVKSNETDAFQ